MRLHSNATKLGTYELPDFTGLGIMMMPFHWHDVLHSLDPEQVGGWYTIIEDLCRKVTAHGVGYVTIDERVVPAGQTHRRPGAHIDGLGAWGGGPGAPYAASGMILLASSHGAEWWQGILDLDVDEQGEVRDDMPFRSMKRMLSRTAYHCTPQCVHRAVPVERETRRQLLRLSLPSNAPHHHPYTSNATGVQPVTPPGPDRSAFMAYRDIQ